MHTIKKHMLTLDLKDYIFLLKPRSQDVHKGDFGKVLIIGGNEGLAGAVRLAGEAALRSGAGLVIILTHQQHAPYLQATRPELIVHGIRDAVDMTNHLNNADVIAIGPGLGQTKWSQQLLQAALQIKDKPMIFDADALNLLPNSAYHSLADHVYTPHPGEAARLLQCKVDNIQQQRTEALNKLIAKYAGIMVLKGAGTLISQRQKPTYICNHGNPGMATAGMGDVLTGIIAALIGQKMPLLDAVCLAVLIHALAADMAAKQGQRGLIASDLFPYLPTILNPL